MKYYAVKVGKTPGIYETWEETKEQVEGVLGAKYKAFSSKEDAQNYLNDVEVLRTDFKTPTAYVDGSFDAKTGRYSFGCVLILDGKEYRFKQAYENDETSSMQNVAGEIKGAGFIILYCKNRGIKELTVYHDYMGISEWYNGTWKANSIGAKKYQDFANEVKKDIDVKFVHVKGHSNDKYNDLVDLLAKEALGIK